MSWAVWIDHVRDVHVVEVLDVTPMQMQEVLPPWHAVGDICPCQPQVLSVDPVTGRRTIGHRDPVQ